MTKTMQRARYTLEFKQEAVRLVEGGQSIAAAARSLGVVDQTLFNWVKAHRAGKLTGREGSWVLGAARAASAALALGSVMPVVTAAKAVFQSAPKEPGA